MYKQITKTEFVNKYPIGSKHEINGETYVVREHIFPSASADKTAYPKIRLDKSTGYKDSKGTLIFVGDVLHEGCNGFRRRVVVDKENGGFRMEGLGDDYRLPYVLDDDWCEVVNEPINDNETLDEKELE